MNDKSNESHENMCAWSDDNICPLKRWKRVGFMKEKYQIATKTGQPCVMNLQWIMPRRDCKKHRHDVHDMWWETLSISLMNINITKKLARI